MTKIYTCSRQCEPYNKCILCLNYNIVTVFSESKVDNNNTDFPILESLSLIHLLNNAST